MELNCRTKTLWSGQTTTSATMRSRSTMMGFGFKWQWQRRSSLSLVPLRSDQLCCGPAAGVKVQCSWSGGGSRNATPNPPERDCPRKPELNVKMSEWELMIVKYYNLLLQ